MPRYRDISLACLLAVFLYSCTKSSSGTTKPPPPPPGGTGNGSGISIASVFPLTPYPGDVITITGTGFDADLTKDTVTFVNANANGNDFSDIYSITNLRFKIVSATTTQIKFMTDSLFLISPSLPQIVSVYVRVPIKVRIHQEYS